MLKSQSQSAQNVSNNIHMLLKYTQKLLENTYWMVIKCPYCPDKIHRMIRKYSNDIVLKLAKNPHSICIKNKILKKFHSRIFKR